jgi:predicted transcriptional regulator
MNGNDELRHPPYYMIEGYAKIAGFDLAELAREIGIHYRTLLRKINGQSDFKVSEINRLVTALRQNSDAIFLTKNIATSPHCTEEAHPCS